MAIILRKEVETQTSAIDSVASLLGDLGLVGRHVELVATTTELTNVVILGGQLRVCRGLIIGAETNRFGVDRGDLRETVIVAVVCVAVADHTKDVCARAVVVRYECGVERGRDIGQSALHYARGIRQREQVALRLLGDDIHHTRNGIRAKESRAATTHNLDTLDHTCGQLLQTINACQRREDRAAIQQNLSILTLQTVDSQLRKTTVRTAILDTHTGLIIERLGDICRRGAVEQLRGNDIDNRRSLLAIRLLAVGRNHHLLHLDRRLAQFEIQFEGLALFERNYLLDRIIAYRRGYYRQLGLGRYIDQHIVASGIGCYAERCATHGDSCVGDMFACAGVDHVADEVSIG